MGTCTNTIEGKWNGLKCATPKKNRGKYLPSFLFQSIWFDQNLDVWTAFLLALGTVRYVTDGMDAVAIAKETSEESNDEEEEPPPSKPSEGERNERILFEEEKPPPSKPSGGECNFVLPTQNSSSESDDEEEFESDEDVRKWGGRRALCHRMTLRERSMRAKR